MSIKDRYQYGPNDKLGEGGFASVYVAYDKTLQRNVALKFYTNKGEHDKSLVNEIRNAINLEHPNLCRYHDVQIENYQNIHGGNDTVEIGIMEFIDGGELDDFLKKQPQYLNKLVKDVLKGLHFLHQKHIIHRDLKPSNILVKNTIDGPVAKIVDFGISKNIDSQKSNSSKLMGTVKYMAPEQFDPATFGINQKIATNVDLWAFGLVLYELVKKEPLVVIKDDLSFSEIANIIHKDIPFYKIEQLPSPYKEMVRVCVVTNANERVKDANDLIEILEGKPYNGGKSTKIIDPENTTTNSTSTSGASFVAKGDYIEGLAWAKTQNGIFGFVDAGNNWVITPKFSGVNNFENGTAQVQLGGRWFKIDRFGNEVSQQKGQGFANIPSNDTETKKSGGNKNIAAIIIFSLVALAFIIGLINRNSYKSEYDYSEAAVDSTSYVTDSAAATIDTAAATVDSAAYYEPAAADSATK